ncbi:hypothetical protein [Herminiimonas contaminans]|uniref:Lysis protein n=1 Tax=Herminiimonas contaminans TaxID=1111140 RepID=A0ABS0EVD8_9BURK|nr:hypothetical protein [Herminiimonas contaminans]MBF8177797.1 hypothetical protein [Herminiimonas contaminans]
MSVTAKLVAALVFVLALVSSHWYVYNAGNRNGSNAVLVKQQESDLQAWKDSAADIAIELDRQQAANLKVSNDYQKELRDIRAYQPAGRLRLPASTCDQIAGKTETTGASRSDGATSGTIALPEDIERRLRDRRKEADGVTAICRGLQNWAIENGFYPAPVPPS